MISQKYRKNFRIIPWDFVEVGEEVKVVTQQTIQMLKKTFAGELDYRGIYRFLAKVLSKDDSGLTIHLALAHISRYHLVSEYLSCQDIHSVKIGPDGNTYVVLRKNKYDSLWKRHSVFFAFIDLIDTKSMFKRSSTAVMQLLGKVQSRIDAFAAMHPNILILG
jgi:hypothetical protein